MTRKNVPLTIVRPGIEELHKINYVANAADQTNVIPYRYPFVDIKNYSVLKTAGFFRHATTDVETTLGGSKVTDTATNLGYQLPRTEKLILLCKVNSALTADKKITIKVSGSDLYKQDDVEYVVTEDITVDTDADLEVEAGDVFEIDLYNMGLYLDANGEVTITAVGNADANADDAKVSFALVSRAL